MGTWVYSFVDAKQKLALGYFYNYVVIFKVK